MSFIVRIAKNIWPRLFVNQRSPVSRSTYLTTETGAVITDENGEAITTQ
jgi:hypothetical protein